MKVFSILCILAFKTPILVMALLVVVPAQIMHGGCPSHGQYMSILSFPTIHCKLDLKLFHLVVHFAYDHQIYFYIWSFFIVSLGRWESFNFMLEHFRFALGHCIRAFHPVKEMLLHGIIPRTILIGKLFDLFKVFVRKTHLSHSNSNCFGQIKWVWLSKMYLGWPYTIIVPSPKTRIES